MPRTETANPSPKHDDRGAVCARWVRCGKPWCRCMQGGPKHGPYFARYWREGGRRRTEYVTLADSAERRAACDERRRMEREHRRTTEEARRAWRTLLAALRAYERLGRGRWRGR